MKRSRPVLPIVLVTAGACLLVGCIYIPTFNKVVSGVDASKKIGDATSRKPLRVGRSTRADVERVLGPPRYVSADGSAVAYTWAVQSGVWLTVCFGSMEMTSMRGVLLKFDGDVLRGYYVEKDASRLRQWIRDNSPETPPWAAPPTPTPPATQTPRQPQPPPAAPGATPPPPPGPTYETLPKPSP